jgi:hypothetical protein
VSEIAPRPGPAAVAASTPAAARVAQHTSRRSHCLKLTPVQLRRAILSCACHEPA